MRIKSNRAVWLLPLLPLMLMLLAFALQCEEPNDIEPDNLITNPSFEIDSQPSLDGWTSPIDLAYYNIFKEDAPPEGGHWSIRLEPGWVPQEGFIETIITGINERGIFELSAWMKTVNPPWNGYISLVQIREGKVIHKKSGLFNDFNEWSVVSFNDTLTIDLTDTLNIKLSAGMAEVSVSAILFDLVSFKKIQ